MTSSPAPQAAPVRAPRAVIIGGDGYASHADCDPAAAVADLSGPDGSDCWICGEELDE